MTAIAGSDRVADEVVPDGRDHQHAGEERDAEHRPRRHAVLATRRQSWWPGTAPSREKANIIREAEVTDAVTQKNCATTQMKSRNSAQFWPIDSAQIQGTRGRRAFDGVERRPACSGSRT